LQIDRARAVYTHGANFADPRRDPGFWKKWQDFEVRYSPASTQVSLI
jgi:pre-mRNA-splicing factor SYF1